MGFSWACVGTVDKLVAEAGSCSLKSKRKWPPSSWWKIELQWAPLLFPLGYEIRKLNTNRLQSRGIRFYTKVKTFHPFPLELMDKCIHVETLPFTIRTPVPRVKVFPNNVIDWLVWPCCVSIAAQTFLWLLCLGLTLLWLLLGEPWH